MWLRMRMLAKVPRIITSWLPRRVAVLVEVGDRRRRDR